MFNVEKTIATKIRCHQRDAYCADTRFQDQVEQVIGQLRYAIPGPLITVFFWCGFGRRYPWCNLGCNLVSARHLEIIADQCERALAVARGRPRSVFAVTLNTHV